MILVCEVCNKKKREPQPDFIHWFCCKKKMIPLREDQPPQAAER